MVNTDTQGGTWIRYFGQDEPYSGLVSFTDGSNTTFSTRERPHMIFADKARCGICALGCLSVNVSKVLIFAWIQSRSGNDLELPYRISGGTSFFSGIYLARFYRCCSIQALPFVCVILWNDWLSHTIRNARVENVFQNQTCMVCTIQGLLHAGVVRDHFPDTTLAL